MCLWQVREARGWLGLPFLSAGCVPCVVWPSVDSVRSHLSGMLLWRFSLGLAINGGPKFYFAGVCLRWYFDSSVDPTSGWELEWSESVKSQQITGLISVDRPCPCICGGRCCVQAIDFTPWVSRLWEPCVFCFVPLKGKSLFQCEVYPWQQAEAISLICIPVVVGFLIATYNVSLRWGGKLLFRRWCVCPGFRRYCSMQEAKGSLLGSLSTRIVASIALMLVTCVGFWVQYKTWWILSSCDLHVG